MMLFGGNRRLPCAHDTHGLPMLGDLKINLSAAMACSPVQVPSSDKSKFVGIH